MPKGALLSHGNLAIACYSILFGVEIEGDRAAMSFLPLAHIYERVMELTTVAVGKRIGYTTGDPTRFLEDIQLLKPHFVPLVPRVLNRVYQSVIAAGDAPGLRGAIFRTAVATKLENLKTRGQFTHVLWDRIVFRKVRPLDFYMHICAVLDASYHHHLLSHLRPHRSVTSSGVGW